MELRNVSVHMALVSFLTIVVAMYTEPFMHRYTAAVFHQYITGMYVITMHSIYT